MLFSVLFNASAGGAQESDENSGGLEPVTMRFYFPGNKPSAADQVFDAFVSSKSEGMGMGLAISRSIIESHGGNMWMTPNSEFGVTFHFTYMTSSTL